MEIFNRLVSKRKGMWEGSIPDAFFFANSLAFH
jgi:hypothetical protein